MDQIANIDLSNGLNGPVLYTILLGVVGAVVRTLIKDYRERQEKRAQILQQCCRQAYNSVTNRVKKGDLIEDKAQAGLEALNRFLALRNQPPATPDQQEAARQIFDAIHGELCPGGTGTPPTSPANGPPSGV